MKTYGEGSSHVLTIVTNRLNVRIGTTDTS